MKDTYEMTEKQLQDIYYSKPFHIRNADEYDLENILTLFIDPTEGLTNPFEFDNSIIKGKMGSGKTMYLRANHAYYLYTLVPSLLDEVQLILPVYIKLSDFQDLDNPEDIYKNILITIIENILDVCDHLKSSENLAKLHNGAHSLFGLGIALEESQKVLDELKIITADDYVAKVSKGFETKGSLTAKFVDACANYSKDVVQEIKKTQSIGFGNLVDVCDRILKPISANLLILFDEVGSLNKQFFKPRKGSSSYFETLMNQLRTYPRIRTKIAIYPNTFSDVLPETRYGNVISLDCDITDDPLTYDRYLTKIAPLIERYVEKAVNIKKIKAEDVFEISIDNQSILEQLVNSSEGNMRRLVYLLDSSMNIAFQNNQGKARVTIENVLEALKLQGNEMESRFAGQDLVFLESLVTLCKNRSTFRFSFPQNSRKLQKYTSLSDEYNIIKIVKPGVGRSGTIYAFDYTYCVYKNIPTHYVKDTERLDKNRSRNTGEIIKRIAQLSDDLVSQSSIRGKIIGIIVYINDTGTGGFIKDDDKSEYFFTLDSLIKSDKGKQFIVGQKVRFMPSEALGEKAKMAMEIELL